MESREQFAHVLSQWLSANEWPQSIFEQWAKAVDSSHGPWNSQINPALHSNLDPKVNFFLSIAAFNQAVAAFDLGSIKDIKLRRKLGTAYHLQTQEGETLNAVHFFQLFTGLIDSEDVCLGPISL